MDDNLRAEYASFAEIEAAGPAFMDEVNKREHRATRRKPAAMLDGEAPPRLHRIPDTVHCRVRVPRGVRKNTPVVTFGNAQYSVPAYLRGARVFVRALAIHSTGVVARRTASPRCRPMFTCHSLLGRSL